MADYSYQKKLITDTIINLDTHKIALMACATASGKTNMAVEVIADYLKKNPTKRVLFLAHGTTTLRQQVARDLKKIQHFTSSEIMGDADTTTQVHVAIPQNKLIRVQQYGLIVVDEAHQYYDAKMVQNIISTNPNCSRLLLTASSGKFTFRKTPAVYFSLLEALDAGTIMEPSIGIITTHQDFRHFDAEGNLSSKEKLKEVSSLVHKFKAKAKGKTLVACHNQIAAINVGKELGKSAVVSTHEEDPNSIDFDRFIKDPKIKYLVVVFKGVVGFSMNELETVVDLTASQNVDRITQLLGRIIRIKKGKKPIYIKLAPKIQTEWYQHVMSAVMTLAHPDAYREWNGHIDSIKIPVTKTSNNNSKNYLGVKRLSLFSPMRVTWSDLNNIFDKNSDLVPLSTIKHSYKRSLIKDYWTFEKCSEDATKYVTLQEWKKYNGSAYHCACLLGISKFHHLFPNMKKKEPPQKWTKELCEIEAKKFESLTEWSRKSNTSYDSARKNNWLEDLYFLFPTRLAHNRSIKCSKSGIIYPSAKVAAEYLKLNYKNINQVLNGKRKSVGGYTFTYVDE